MNVLKKIYNKNVVILIYILLPLVEVITTVSKTYTNCTFTFGMIYKTLFLIYGAIYLLFIAKENRKINLTLLLIYLVYIVTSFCITTEYITLNNLVTKLTILARFICFPVMILFLYSYLKENYISTKVIGISAVIYGLVMLVSNVTNTAFASYSAGLSKGNSGWFNSGNEISALFSMFLPVLIYLFAHYKKLIYLIGLLLISFSLCVIGTKTALIGLIITSIIFLIYSIVQYIRKSNNKMYEKIVVLSTLYVVLVAFVIPITPAYIGLNEKLEATKSESSESSEVILSSFIYNGREQDLKEQFAIYMDAPISQKLFGINDEAKLLTTSGEFNVIERDFYDIVFIHGLIGFGVFCAPMVLILLDRVLKLKKEDIFKLKNVMLLTSIVIAIGVSYIAGHVFLSSTVAIFLAYITVSICIDEKEEKQIVIYMPKLSVGGMERALINYLNMCKPLDKYKVTLVLGYVTDMKLISELPKNIDVRLLCTRKWDKIGKIQAGLNYIVELIYIMIYNYDISICYSYHHKVLSILTRLASKSNILFMHTDLITSRSKEEITRLNKNVKFEKFSSIVCVSDKAKKSMEILYPNYTGKLVAIYNYINGDSILELSKEKCDIVLDNNISFINVSRHFERAKKISRIIDATFRLKKEGYNFKVYLVGEGENTSDYLDKIKELKLEDSVYLLGRQNNPYKYMKRADFLVISSDFEGYGIVIDEAKVLNLPIISTDIADAKKMVEGYGKVFENSSEGIYEGMKSALDNMVKIDKKFSYIDFNIRIDEEFDSLFNELLDRRKDKDV